MIQRYLRLFSIDVRHGYYGGPCEDFDLFVPTSTASMLRGGRSLLRTVPGGWEAWYDAGGQGDPLVDLTGRTLWFGLRLSNRRFDNFTVPVVVPPGHLPYYSNSQIPTTFGAASDVRSASGVYPYVPRLATRPLELKLLTSDATIIETHTVALDADHHSFDLRGFTDGEYRVVEHPTAGDDLETRLAISAELRGAGLWGLLAIRVDRTFYAAPPIFSLIFSARSERLKYYVIASDYSPSDRNQLSVTDAGFGEESRAQIEFERLPPEALASDELVPALLNGGDSAGIVVFRSTQVVARRVRGYRKLQLNRNGNLLVSDLPLPAQDDPQAQFIIHLSRPKL